MSLVRAKRMLLSSIAGNYVKHGYNEYDWFSFTDKSGAIWISAHHANAWFSVRVEVRYGPVPKV